MSKGMVTCKVCGRDFALIAEEHYIARDVEETGIAVVLGRKKEAEQYDAFDCPHCGCQNIMQVRKALFLFNELISQEKEAEDVWNCEGCKYDDKSGDEYPCVNCGRTSADLYEKKED